MLALEAHTTTLSLGIAREGTQGFLHASTLPTELRASPKMCYFYLAPDIEVTQNLPRPEKEAQAEALMLKYRRGT